MIDYLLAKTDEDYKAAESLFREYAGAINIDLSFQNFENELSGIKEMYGAPNGGIILCKNEIDYIGCVAIRKTCETIGELKRMFVKPAFQNLGVGKVLLEKALELAENCNYELVRLDTLNYMQPAINLYRRYGFYETEPYYHNPNTTAIFFEKKLKAYSGSLG